jgi:pilus assembly protein CpaB
MRLSVVVLILLSLTVAGGAAYMTNSWLQSERAQVASTAPKAPAPAPERTEVLVAAADLPAGRIVQPGDLSWQPWPDRGRLDAYVEKTPETAQDQPLLGAVVRASMIAGEPITETRVVRPGDRGFLAAMLREGHRALSVPVNATSGLSGLIFPGDRVDVVLTHKSNDGARTRQASETVLRDIRVLALDQRTDDQEGERVVASTATLEVTPKQVEALSLALQLGRLSLSLRPIARAGGGDAESKRSFTFDREISVLANTGGETGPLVEVVRGSASTQVEVAQ